MVYDARGAPIFGPHAHQSGGNQQQQHMFSASGDTRGSTRSVNLQSPLTQCIWILFWLFVLILAALPIASLAVLFHVFLQPFAACTCNRTPAAFAAFLIQLLRLPSLCARNLIDAKPLILI
jgi:hypothetical protein